MGNKILSALVLVALCAVPISAAGNNKNHAGLFLGSTTNFYTKHTDFTIGGDYEYRFHNILGAGQIVDFVLAKKTETILAPALFIHPWRGLKAITASGVAIVDGHTHFALRAALGYDIDLGGASLAPTVVLDFINGHFALVYGAAIGYGF